MSVGNSEGRSRGGIIGEVGSRWRRATATEPTGAEIAENARRVMLRRVGRRRLLQNTAIGTTAAYMLHGLPTVVWEILIPHFSADVRFLRGQEDRLRQNQTDTLSLVFPGAQVRVGRRHAEPLASELSHIGAVAYVSYANNDPDITGIADKIEQYQRKHTNLQGISLYGVSLGAQISAGVMGELEKRGNPLKLKSVILDSTPPDLSYTDFPWAATLVKPVKAIGGDAVLTAAGNYKVFGNVVEPGSTPPRLLIAQLGILHDGIRYLDTLSRIVRREGARVAFLTAQNPEADATIDPIRSEQRFKQFFPRMDTFKVTGNGGPDNWMGHANPDQNGIGYRKALREMRSKWKITA